jgi:hypothetical protein
MTAADQPAAPTQPLVKTAADLTGRLDAVRRDAHDAFPDNAGRLEQLDSHLATVAMVIEHMADEAGRATA